MNLHAGSEVHPAALLAPATDTVSPIRFDDDPNCDLRQLGTALALGEDDLAQRTPPMNIAARLEDNARRIRSVTALLDAAARAGQTVTPAANWMLDNMHLIEEAILQARNALSPRMLRALPPAGADGVPRVTALAWNYVAHADSAVTEAGFTALVEGYQSLRPLRTAELWALPAILRFVLIENLRRLAMRVNHSREMRALADEVADRLLSARDASELEILEPRAGVATDKSFATQLLHRLHDGSERSLNARAWLEARLGAAGSDAEKIVLKEQGAILSGNVTTANIVRGLRLTNDIQWAPWFESVSRVDRILREQTHFAALDFPSRDTFRRRIEELAGGAGIDEAEATQRAVALAREAGVLEDGKPEIGAFLVGDRQEELERALGSRPPWRLRLLRMARAAGIWSLLVPVTALTALFVAGLAWALAVYGVGGGTLALLLVLFALPASEAALGIFNTAVSILVRPHVLIGYEYAGGVPEEARTLVAVPLLIGSPDDVDEALRNLEVHYLANATGALHFAIVSDWPDSPVEQTPADDALLQQARAGIARLNALYPAEGAPRFHLLHRQRLYNAKQGAWMGWERKRGKLHEMNALLRGDRDTSFLDPGAPLPENVRYVMTVDADTRVTRDAVTRLVGKLAHPLNRPGLDASGRVTSGYGILQPRVTPSLTTGDKASFFQRIFSAGRGIDPYVFAVSDVYQDLWGAGSFTGKGLYHIDAMEAALDGKVRENSVLSHDLLEGAYARCALTSDVELIEDYPSRYGVDAARHHRWARGDWQLLPHILDSTAGIDALSRFKMIDNLRRSLMAPGWVAASVAGWTLLSLPQAVQWQALLVLSLFLSLTYGVIDSILARDRKATLANHFATAARDTAFASAQVVMKVTLMAHTAWSMGDAIVRTLYRLFVSRRNLLEWRTASDAARGAARDLPGHYRMMAGALAIAAAAMVPPLAAGSSGAWVGAFFALLWAASPAIAFLVSQPETSEEQLDLAPQDAAVLRRIARRTWLYFETFVTPEHNMLPPDNFQEDPEPRVAARTSPTNIGVYLLSAVAARDFGWTSLRETVDRLDDTLSTLETMQRHRGHLFNWYETRTLAALHPRYVSSVDSGNLAGHLIAVAHACQNWSEATAVHLQGEFEGILDTAGVLRECLDELPEDRRRLKPLRERLIQRVGGLCRAVETIRAEPETAPIRAISLSVLARDIVKLARTVEAESAEPATTQIVVWAENLLTNCEAHLADSHVDEAGVAELRERLAALHTRARRFAFEMDFGFLMRKDRKLLSIGYRVEEDELDESCYDLLASEARLTSLFAIAKGDLPRAHWMRLGRPVTQIGFRAALLSWSGSMFEYLMPPLVMKEPLGGLLNQTSNLIIARQMRHAAAKGVPWGISEAAFHARDREMNYQYTNFGVPGLGLKRGLGRDLVIAPYASLLACQFRPLEALANLKRLAGLGALGRYGFHDAVDFTPARVPSGELCAVVRNYYAHHHGMSITAIVNAVFEGRMRDRFHADPVIEAAELLLQEKAPRSIPASALRPEADEPAKSAAPEERRDMRRVADPLTAPLAVALLSNGRYSAMMTAAGTGWGVCGDLQVTRWDGDAAGDANGTFLFLSDVRSGEWWSATPAPRRLAGEKSSAVFRDDRVTFHKSVRGEGGRTLRTELECIVATEADGEARRLTLYNEGGEDRFIEVTSFAEIALAARAADAAHPAFSKMFVRTSIADDGATIFAERRARAPGDPAPALAHFMSFGEGIAREVCAQTDRRAFIGRGRSLAQAAAFDPGARLTGRQGDVLDPVAALRCRVRVPRGKKVVLTFWTVIAQSRGQLEADIRRLRDPAAFERQAMLAWTYSQVETRHAGLSLADASTAQRLARFLIHPHAAMRTAPEHPGGQSDLWPMGISGDYPILVLRIVNDVEIENAAMALRMHDYLRRRGLVFDLVILNEKPSSYIQDLQHGIENLCSTFQRRGNEIGPRKHIFAVRRDLMGERSADTLMAAARVVLHAGNGGIQAQVERAEALVRKAAQKAKPPAERSIAPARPVIAKPAARDAGAGLSFWNGYGGFSPDGRDYVVRLSGTEVTPQPWINVVAGSDFGFHASAEGASFTWSRNSRDFHLTPWSNDPVRNRPGEAVYLHDLDTGRSFSPLACVLRDPAVTYEARFGAGFCTFRARRGDLESELTQLADPQAPVKVSRLVLRNHGRRRIRLRVYLYAEWVLGNDRSRTLSHIVTAAHAASGLLTARNPFSLDYGTRLAFLASDAAVRTLACDRAAFIGRGGSLTAPEAVLHGLDLAGAQEPAADPCAVIAADLEIAAGGKAELKFALGDADAGEDVAALAAHHLQRDFDARLAENEAGWENFFSTLTVETPDKAFDLMVNRWLPYQSLACRLRARAAFYQASGAYGFRDQLQDTLSLLLHDPELARAQILGAAGRQFPEGDVQHWWLPATGAGVRTTIADGVAWLAHATAHYVETTGDEALLDVEIPFIEGPALEPGQHDAFFVPEASQESASLYEHCARALDLALARFGPHGLPLIMGGDWNDGMNRVGEEGRGESVWLGWFLLKALSDFSALAQTRGDGKRAADWRERAQDLQAALEEHGWDGNWYRRAFYDDGTPLGSLESDECRIDSIAQSWAVLSGRGDPARARQALSETVDRLVDEEAQAVLLFTPPFERTEKDPGYIKAYPPGVRENGGQYTHAAAWLVIALARLGRADEAWRLFSMLNPVNHALDRDAADRYRVEPYVVAADVYSGGDLSGRGGWTWYTGSAGWLYRAAVEAVLGITRRGDRLFVEPALPSGWDGYRAALKIGGATYRLVVRRGGKAGLEVDGRAGGDHVPLFTDGEHEVVVTIS